MIVLRLVCVMLDTHTQEKFDSSKAFVHYATCPDENFIENNIYFIA